MNDCFALNPKNSTCRVLNVGKCTDPECCVFYKTHDQFEQDKRDAEIQCQAATERKLTEKARRRRRA